MKWENFKKRLSEETHQQKNKVDVDAIWNMIEPTVDDLNQKKKKRRRFIFWFYLAGAAMLLCGFWIGKTWNEKEVLKKEILEKRVEVAESQAVTEVKNNDIVSVDKNKKLSENNETNQKSEVSSFSNSKKITKLHFENIKSIFKNPDRNDETEPIFGKKENDNFTILSKEKNENSTFDILLKKETANIFQEEKDHQVLIPKLNEEKKNVNVLFLSAVFPKINAPKTAISIDENKLKFYHPRKKNKFQFSISAIGGMSAVNRKFTLTNPSQAELFSLRNNFEKTLEAVHYGALFGVEHHTGFQFSIGLQQTRIAEKYEFNEVQITNDSILGVAEIRVNLDGDSISIMGMLPRTTTKEIEKRFYNTYRLLDIPILLGYQKSFGKWKSGVEAGILLNLSLKTDGTIPNELLEDTEMESVYLKKLNIGYQFGVTLSRSVFENLEFQIAPTLRIYPDNFTNEDYGVEQNYTLFGGMASLRYKF